MKSPLDGVDLWTGVSSPLAAERVADYNQSERTDTSGHDFDAEVRERG